MVARHAVTIGMYQFCHSSCSEFVRDGFPLRLRAPMFVQACEKELHVTIPPKPEVQIPRIYHASFTLRL